jgi:hypothetical protein
MPQMREMFVQQFFVANRPARHMEKPYGMRIIDFYASKSAAGCGAMAYFDEVAAFDEIDFCWLRV